MAWDDSPWKTILAAALVGTQRQPFQRPVAGGRVGDLINQLSDRSPEATLLQAAAILSLHQQAGQLPEKRSIAPNLCEPETLPPCPPTVAQFLQRMLLGESIEVLPEWLAIVAQRQERIPEFYLPGLLDLAFHQSHLRPLLLPVLGARGRWLAAQNPSWRFAIELGTQIDWETSNIAARVLYLQDLRSEDPDRSRELLMATWKQEAAGDRSRLLETFATNLSMADEPMLEGLLDDRSKEVRRVAANLLSSLPESRLAQRMKQRLEQCVKFKPNGELEISLPETCDAAMLRDGIVEVSSSGMGNRNWWLQQIISSAPLEFWDQSDGFGFGEWQYVLMNGWQLAAVRQRNQKWAAIVLDAEITLLDVLRSLLDVLPFEEQECFVIIRMQPKNDSSKIYKKYALNLLRAMAKSNQIWGKKFSTLALARLAEYLSSDNELAFWIFSQLMKDLALCISPHVLAEVDQLRSTTENPHIVDRIDEFLVTLKFRYDLFQASQQ